MSVYSDFNAFCIANFGALAEPLVRATFGSTPAFVVAGDWVYPSRNSASIAFETNLPCKGRVEWGTTTAYGNLTALPDRFYYNHLHYLTGLTPGVTYHYRLVAVDESGVTVTSADRTITTLAMASAIAIPGGSYAAPYACDTAGATYILTGNITAAKKAIYVTVNNCTIDLNGYSITYDTAAPTVDGLDYLRSPVSSMGVHYFKDNANGVAGQLTRILNGTITQGANNGTGSSDGSGFNPVGIWEGRTEVAGITAVYAGIDVGGIMNRWGPVDAHHNIIQDGGTGITNRSQGVKGIYAGSVGPTGIHHNAIRRTRHQGIMQKYASLGVAGIFSNEVYGDVMATNGYQIGAYPLVYSNKIFGTGYHCVALSHFVDSASADISMLAHHNFIHLHGGAPFNSSCPLDSDTDPDASVIGIRLTYYLGETRRYDNYIYEYNTIIVRGNSTKDVRGAQLGTSQYHSGNHFRNNTVKYETTTSVVRGAAINLQGNTTPGAAANENPCYVENNTILTNDRFLRFGDKYSCGGHQQFRNNTFTKTGTSGTYEAIRFGEANNPWDSYGNRMIDSVLGTGVSFSSPAADGTGGRRDLSLGHSLYITAKGVGLALLPGTTVQVYDNSGLSFTGTTDAQGVVRLELVDDFYEALNGAGAFTHSTRSGWNLQTAGYAAYTLTPAQMAVSNNFASPIVIQFTTGAPPPDTTAPAAVTLAVGSATPTTLTLSWTAPGDDGTSGTAFAYEVRRSIAPITAGNFASATLCAGPPTPAAAGTPQTMIITGLQPGSTWYFALRASDEVPNWSPVSNSPSAQTTPQPSDLTAPGQITDLSVVSLDTSTITVGWTAPGDDLGVGRAAFYELGFGSTPMVSSGGGLPIVTNGSLRSPNTTLVTGSFVQDIGNNQPADAVTITLAALDKPIMHFVPPCTATYAACLSAICGSEYQLTALGGPGNLWDNPSANVAGAPDGAFGAPTAGPVIAGTLISRTFARATVYANMSKTTPVSSPVGILPALGSAIVQGAGYGSTNVDGYFPQRGGIFWGQTTAGNLAVLAAWKTWVGNNSQTEGPTEGINSATPVADWRAARAAAVPTNPTGRFLESHNGLTVFVDGSGHPSIYFPLQQRLHAFCQANAAWIMEGGSPLQGTSLGSTTRYFDVRNVAFRAFFAEEVSRSCGRCGADGVFGDEWHIIHPMMGETHPTVPEEIDQTAGMIAICGIMGSDFNMNSEVLSQIPKDAGQSETYTIRFLTPSNLYWVALRATDESGNVSILSNQVSAMTDDLGPPSDIADLVVVSTSQTTVSLEWTAPEDAITLGDFGPAYAYDMRRSTSPINSGNFTAATSVVPMVGPTAPGVIQSVVVSGLSSSTLYYFALRSVDLRGNYSGISNVVSVATTAPPDVIGPAAVTNLSVSIPTQSSLRLTWTAPGDDGNFGTATAYDLRYSSAPITDVNFATRTAVTGLPTPGPAGTAEVKNVTSGLSASTTYYFALKTRDEAGNWSAISNLASGSTTAAPDVTAPSTIANLATTNLTSSSVTLTWTAPGDDAAVGTPTSYEIRYSTSAINSGNFAAATLVSGPPVPLVAGSAQSKIVTGLTASTLYYFAMKATDEAGNVSALSNVPTGTTTGVADVIAPDAVVNLAVASVTQTTATLSWTAPGDDAAAGTAASYDIRYSTSTITSGNWAAATQFTGEPAPSIVGTVQAMTVTGLTAGTTYYFAMKTLDEVPNTSGLSNVATGTTNAVTDTTAPEAISNLTAPVGSRTSSSITLNWTAPGDDGATGIATQYDVRISESPIDSGNFLAALSLTGAPIPALAGTTQTMVVSGLAPSTYYYFAIKAADEMANWSPISNVVLRSTAAPPTDTTQPATVADLAIVSYDSNSILLSFTAPGDDGAVGTAATYDIRYSTLPITEFTFASETQVAGPTPSVAGTVENVIVTGLAQGTRYYIALRVLDEAGNSSGMSNVVSTQTTLGLRRRRDVYTSFRVRKEVKV